MKIWRSITIDYAGTLNINSWLKVTNIKLIECVYWPLLKEGIETLHEVVLQFVKRVPYLQIDILVNKNARNWIRHN